MTDSHTSSPVPPGVVIVGAGPTGLTAALELSRLGVAVRIVDRAEAPSPESRALAVQARTMELLRVRGITGHMLDLGNPATAATLHASGRPIAGVDLSRMPSEFNYILMLAQSETERLLTEQLARQGVKVERGIEVIAVRDRRSHVDVEMRNPDGSTESVDAHYVIAADGPHSTVRTCLGVPFPGRTLPHSYALADLSIEGALAHDRVSVFLARHGFVAVFPMGGGRFRLMATDPDGVVDSPDPSVEQIQHLFDRVVGTPARLHSMNWSSRFRISSRHLSALRYGRVFFGGDAAHVHSPAGGQGMNVGIQDMVNLSWKLAMVLGGRARPELLDTYSQERLPVIRAVVRFTEIGTRVFNSTNPIVHALRVRIAPRVLARQRVQRMAASMFGQLSAGYRGVGMAAGMGGGAGERVVDRDGLYDELALDGLTLFTDSAPVADVARAWEGVVTVQPGRGPGWMLVRPDGYLAASGGAGAAGEDVAAVDGLLRRWFVASAGADRSTAR